MFGKAKTRFSKYALLTKFSADPHGITRRKKYWQHYVLPAPLEVKTAVPFPYGFEFVNSIASSILSTFLQIKTGPKISS
jgi:hypothetical protein